MQGLEQQNHGLLKGSIGKARGQALRLSLLLEYLWWACAAAPEPTQVTGEAMQGALTLMTDYFIPMAKRIFGDAAIPREERNAKTLARWIADHRPAKINVSSVRDGAKLPGLRHTAEVRAACQYLEEAGWLIADPAIGPHGGRPRGDYKMHPKLWEALAT